MRRALLLTIFFAVSALLAQEEPSGFLLAEFDQAVIVGGQQSNEKCWHEIVEISCGTTGGCTANANPPPFCNVTGLGCDGSCKGGDRLVGFPKNGTYRVEFTNDPACGKKMKNPYCSYVASTGICECRTQDPGDNGNCDKKIYKFHDCQEGGGSE